MSVIQRIYERESKEKTITKSYSLFAVYFVAGFVLSFGRVVGDVAPFGISLVAASRKKYFAFAAAGAALGCVVTGFNENAARYLAGIALAALGSLAAAAFELHSRPSYVLSVAFFADFISGFVLNLSLGADYQGYILLFSESVLCSGGAFFFYRSINACKKRIRPRALPVSDLSCIMISLSILLMNLSFFTLGGICPARIGAMLFVLYAVRFAPERRALIFALSLGFSLGIYNKGTLFLVGAFAFAALVAFLFKPFSYFAAGTSFFCSMAFFAIASKSEITFALFIEALAATLIFVLTPPRLSAKIEKLFFDDLETAPDGSLRQNLVLKLRFASHAMAAISESVDEVRERINDIVRRKNELERETLSDEEYIRREIVLEKTNQIRSAASDQFFSIADMLSDLAFEFDEAETFDTQSAMQIRRVLASREIYPGNICVIEDKFKRVRVEILTDSDISAVSDKRLTEEIGKICSRYFDEPQITNFKNESMLSYFEKPNYILNVGYAQHSAEGKLCGDTVKVVNDGKGRSILIISDGMGKGSRAALDGAMGAGLIAKLICAGFGFDSALKVVNSALLVKSSDESLATIDIASVDLFTGKCEMFKAGAPASYILKNKGVTKCELTSMPAGILRAVEFAKRTAVLSEGDAVALMSDGICDLGDGWVSDTLTSVSDEMGVQEAADAILTRALCAMKGKKIDDMSIVYAKLERN